MYVYEQFEVTKLRWVLVATVIWRLWTECKQSIKDPMLAR